MNKQHSFLMIVSVALLLLLTGCTVQKRSEVTTQNYKLGFMGPQTGDAASIGVPNRETAELALEEFNANSDKKIDIVFEDDRCEGKTATTVAQKLIDQDKVSAIIGTLCSSALLATAPIAEPAQVVMLSYGATSPKIKDAGDYVFRVVPSDAGQGKKAAALVKGSGAKKVGVLFRNDDWGVGISGVFVNEAKKLGLDVTVESLEPGSNDVRTQLTKIKEFNPDAIYMPLFPAEAPIVLKQIKELGITATLVGADASKDDTVLTNAGDAAEGFTVTLPAVPESAELTALNEKFKAKYNKDSSAYNPETWDATMILLNACAKTDCTGSAIKDYLNQMGEYNGVSGTFEFDEFGEVEKSYDLFVVKDGKFVKQE
ncbi:MAG: ABC transporter substrate-binding protein [Candidatus Woesearchaeota archaeon]|nr:ABC transporter substrate-binding protein [Candidatus Woesearchaeota archaeon]